MHNLYELVKEAQNGNNDATMNIIEKFSPLIRKYSRKLNYDVAYTDLIISLIETIKYIPIFRNENIKKEECLVAYISKSLIHKYIRLSKRYRKVSVKEVELNNQIFSNDITDEIENTVFINKILSKLPKTQENILKQMFIYGYRESEIASQLNISRQAVNKTKKRALNSLRKYLAS